MSGPIDHPERHALTAEVHARPFVAMDAPTRLVHIAMLSGEGGAAEDRAHLARLCAHFGVAAPAGAAIHAVIELGRLRLKWERHAEFCSWTFFAPGRIDDPFAGPVLGDVPDDWLAATPGHRLVPVRVALVERATASPTPAELARWFTAELVAGSRVAGGGATAWTDFAIHGDGYGRILLHDHTLRPRQAGRVVLRLLEIGTYRVMALLALPVAREIGPRVSGVDRDLLAITEAMRDMTQIGEERGLLERLIALAAEVERLTAASAYRFGAGRAYWAIVERRLAELREERIEGLQTIREVMERRLVPAMRTCEATAARLDAIAARLARASALLRTRVDIKLEAQNQDVLASMNRRARLQLRLQATVEGLSVAAISYYVVGLAGYGLKSLEAAGVIAHPDRYVGVALLIVVPAVWYLVRRIRRHLTAEPRATFDA